MHPPLQIYLHSQTTLKTRKKFPLFHLTGTPVKETFKQKKIEQEERERKETGTIGKKGRKGDKNSKKNTKTVKTNKMKHQLFETLFSYNESIGEVPYVDTDDDMDSED